MAIQLYEAAAAQIKVDENIEKSSAEYRTTLFEETYKCLENQLISQLQDLDLVSSPSRYDDVYNAIYNWDPGTLTDTQTHQIGIVQSLLMNTILPPLQQQQQQQQKQTLIHACETYAAYMENVIKEQLQTLDAPLYNGIFELQESVKHFVKNAGVITESTELKTGGMLLLLSIDQTQDPQSGTQLHHQKTALETIKDQNPIFRIALDKYQAVSKLQASLKSEKPVSVQLQDFRNTYSLNRHIIEQRRDKATITFLKTLGTVLSLGIAAAFGLWKTNGHKTTKEIDHSLRSSPSHRRMGG